jgi:hypothetical protein
MQGVLLNISGHRLSEEAQKELSKEYIVIEDIIFSNIDFSQNLEIQIKELFIDCKTNLDGSIPITIIPPGQSTFAILLYSYLHGILGYPPNICYLEADKDNFFSPKSLFKINLNEIKTSGRAIRQEIWKKN